MFQQIEQLLAQFRPCFSRKAAFGWFVTVIAGFMLRGDQLGVTSVIRDLSLSPGCYELLIHFFHSDAWDPDVIRKTWWKLLAERAPVYRVKKRCILIGDGVKQSKEAFHMAGVKKLLQESENSSKPRFIFGHMFGAVGILIGRRGGKFCAPLQMNIQDGLRAVSSWDGSGISPDSHVVQMVRHSCAVAKVVGTAYLLLDRYFLSVPALKELKAHNDADDTPRVDIITKAKSNCRAYRKPRACRSHGCTVRDLVRTPGHSDTSGTFAAGISAAGTFDSGTFAAAAAPAYHAGSTSSHRLLKAYIPRFSQGTPMLKFTLPPLSRLPACGRVLCKSTALHATDTCSASACHSFPYKP